MIVPLPLLRILQLPRSQKVVLLFIFLTPLFAIFFAIMNLISESIKTLGPTINPVRLLLFSTLEISIRKYPMQCFIGCPLHHVREC